MPEPCKVGDRIRLTNMPDDPCPIEPGSEGTVTRVHALMGRPYEGKTQISVTWDSGRTLSLLHPIDSFEVI